MNTIIPILIPYNNEPEHCPKCDKKENIKSVCAHCGYEYKEEKYSIYVKIYIIGAIITFVLSLLLFKFIFYKSMCLDIDCGIIDYLVMVLVSLAIAWLWPLSIIIGILIFLLSL